MLTRLKDGPGVEYLSLLLQSFQRRSLAAGGGGMEQVTWVVEVAVVDMAFGGWVGGSAGETGNC